MSVPDTFSGAGDDLIIRTGASISKERFRLDLAFLSFSRNGRRFVLTREGF